jgi:hypothetical protein
MRQLVGVTCVRREQRIGSIVEGRFCGECGCPVHNACVPPLPVRAAVGTCSACGAPTKYVEQEARQIGAVHE